MFCPNCGNKMDDDSRFCPTCGTPVENEVSPVNEVTEENGINVTNENIQVEESTPVVESVPVMETAPAQETTTSNENNQYNQNTTSAPKKSFNILTLIIALVVVAVVAVGGFFIAGSFSSSDTAVVYVKKDTLYYKADANSSKEAYEVTDIDCAAEEIDYRAFFSEDGKYLYFFTDIDYEGLGTLNCIKVSNIKADKEKNEDKIEEISDNVNIYYLQNAGDTGVLYYTKNSRLEYYNGKESAKIVKNCDSFSYDEEKNVLVYTVMNKDDYTYDLYAGTLSLDMDAEKIDKNIDNVYSLINPDFIIYTKNDGTELYEAGIGKAPERITKAFAQIGGIDSEQKQLIYIENEEKAVTLYDYIDDDSLASDGGITEPNVMDYASVVTLDEVMDSVDKEYYAEYPEELEGFYNWLWEDYYTGMQYYYNSDVEKYYYYDGTNWYYIDETLYERALEEYAQNADRIELREDLKETEYAEYLQKAYYYTSGKDAELLIEGVNSIEVADVATKMLTYQKADYEKVKMSEIGSAWDVYNYLEEYMMYHVYCKIADGEEVEIGTGYVNEVSLSENKGECAIVLGNESGSSILIYKVKNNTLSDANTLTEEEKDALLNWRENTLYYVEDIEDGSGDLCVYENGKNETIVKNISTDTILVDEAENSLILEYDEDGYYKAELYNAKHDKVEKFTNFRLVSYISSDNIIFMKKEKLCVYDGSDEMKEIEKNVDYVITYTDPETVTDYTFVY